MPSNSSVVTKRYYPKLSEVITVDDLPDFLDFVENALNDLLDGIHYKNLQFSKSFRGDAAFYSLEIVSANIGLNLPFGLRLVLNPDETGDSQISSFPVTLEYQWGVLAFLRTFKLENFAFTPEAFYYLGLQIFKISDDQVLANILNFFVEPATDGINKFGQLLNDLNQRYPGANLTLPPGVDPSVSAVASLIKQNTVLPDTISAVMFDSYVLGGDEDKTKERLQQFYNIVLPGGIEAYIRDLIIPKFRATLKVSAGIEFPNNVIRPVTIDGTPLPGKTIFKFGEATLFVDSEAGIGIEAEIEGTLIPTYNEIGTTGLTIAFQKAKLDLSRTSNIPEADAAGYPVDFVGLYVKYAYIGFNKLGGEHPGKPSASISAENLLIGTGGVSGKITLDSGGRIYRRFGNDENYFALELDTFSVTFRQNAIIDSTIHGKLTLSSFKDGAGNPAIIDIEVAIHENGDFSITAKPLAQPISINLLDTLRIDIRKLEFGSEGGHFYIEVAGLLSLTTGFQFLDNVMPKGFEIQKLRIRDDGKIEFRGGKLNIPKAFALKIGPVKMEVTNLSIGSYQGRIKDNDRPAGATSDQLREYTFVGFDGMINTGIAGIKATGNGIKYYFTTDNGPGKPPHHFLSIEGIIINLTLPGNVPKEQADFILEGILNVQQPTSAGSVVGNEYTGKVSFSIPKLSLSGSAGMQLNPDRPSFIVDIGLELATPIPLGGALGIYGFRGVIGHNYGPSKETVGLAETDSWWEYYKRPGPVTHKKGIQVDKFADDNSFAIGAGVSVATTFDSGFAFSSKLFLFLNIPGMFALDGQAGILRSRLGLNDDRDPPFTALIVFDPGKSFSVDIGIDYKIPDSGFIFSLHALLQAHFFFNNSTGWFINIGVDQPADKRVRASVLTLFEGYAYLMISSRGIKAGAGASFNFRLNLILAEIKFGASIDLGGFISFRPVQMGGFAQVGGHASVRVLIFTVGVAVNMGVSAEAPSPFNLIGYLEFSFKIIFKRFRFRLEVRFKPKDTNISRLLDYISVLQLPDPTRGYYPAIATNIRTNETFMLNYLTTEGGDDITLPKPTSTTWKYNAFNATAARQVTIPLDSFIDIELQKPVKPNDILGGASNQLPEGYSELIPPQKGETEQVKHEYNLTGIEIYAWKGDAAAGEWMAYNIYEAVTAIVEANPENSAMLRTLKPGYWQFTDKNKYNKIRLMSQDMFSYLGRSDISLPDMDALNFFKRDLFCFDSILKTIVLNWKQVLVGTDYPPNVPVNFDGVNITFDGVDAVVAPMPDGGQALRVGNAVGRMIIDFPEPQAYVAVQTGPNAHRITVAFMRRVRLPGIFNLAITLLVPTDTQIIEPGGEGSLLVFENSNNPVVQVRIAFSGTVPSDYTGDLVAGGHVELPAEFGGSWLTPAARAVELPRAVTSFKLYDRSLQPQEIIEDGAATGTAPVLEQNFMFPVTPGEGLIYGSPYPVPLLFKNVAGDLASSWIYIYLANADACVVPYTPPLKVENDSFAFEALVVFDPFRTGVMTVLSKLTDGAGGHARRGYALQISLQAPSNRDAAYGDSVAVPTYQVWLTTYNGEARSGLVATDTMTISCQSGKLLPRQYKHIAVSVDRSTGKLSLYLDRQLKLVQDIPAELSVFESGTVVSFVEEIRYRDEELQARVTDNQPSEPKLIDEVRTLSDGLNKTVQPIWRPDTIYAVKIHTQDFASHPSQSADHRKTHVFGFKTAGPVGHFHQQNNQYLQLQTQDRAGEFKLASLKSYIDYERSFPDPQGRFDLSKPVFCHDPLIRLYFTEAYMNAMFGNWDAYQGLPAVQSWLEVQLIDPYQVVSTQSPETTEREFDITIDNYRSLPPSQQLVFLFNLAASLGECNPMPVAMKKRIRETRYVFGELLPGRLYTALFKACYQPAGKALASTEIHKFNFITSRYASFQEQVASINVPGPDGENLPNIVVLPVSFTDQEIDDRLKKLVNDNPADDPADALHYASPYDRLLYSGFGLLNFVTPQRTGLYLIVNTTPGDPTRHRLLAILVNNPEPFNEPKFPAEVLTGTIKLKVTAAGGAVAQGDDFRYILSADTSGVIITNPALEMLPGMAEFSITERIFNGIDYTTDQQVATVGPFDLTTYLPDGF